MMLENIVVVLYDDDNDDVDDNNVDDDNDDFDYDDVVVVMIGMLLVIKIIIIHFFMLYTDVLRAKFNWELRKSMLMKRIKVKTKGNKKHYYMSLCDADFVIRMMFYIINFCILLFLAYRN